MPLTPRQRTLLAPRLDELRDRCVGLAPPERAAVLRDTLERVDATPTWAEWEAFVREELGALPAALARPDEAP